jgi:hypothetical protein
MKGVVFTADFANKVIGDKIVVDGMLARQLIDEGVAILDPDQSGAVAKTILSKKRANK